MGFVASDVLWREFEGVEVVVGLLRTLLPAGREERHRTLVRGRRRHEAFGGTRRVGRGGIVSRRSLEDLVGGRGSSGRGGWFAPRLFEVEEDVALRSGRW